jgi:phosphoribosylaminoimidazole (AIR) synthetase
MGIGYLIVTDEGDAARATALLTASGERVACVGEIRAGTRGVEYA